MLFKLVVFGAGYVLGSKAGRERYNQISAIAQKAARQLDNRGVRNQYIGGNSLSSFRSNARTSGQSKV
jgi:hypothetical protein